MEIKPLNAQHVHLANYNSFGGKRGDLENLSYVAYATEIAAWPIGEDKKRKLLDTLHKKYSEIMSYAARHVSVMVAGPARYNARKLDHGDKILQLSAELCQWFNNLKGQLKQGMVAGDREAALLERIAFCDSRPELDPTNRLAELSSINNAKFIELFEALLPKYRWRKNSTIYKIYTKSLAGEFKEIKKEIFFDDANFTAYREGDRAYIKFTLKPARQLMVALKSRGWFWNAYKSAWSTYLEKVDEAWVATISERYASYI